MKPLMLMSVLLGLATAEQMSASCRNIVLDPATEIISAECNDGQGSNAQFKATSLDLNTCLQYSTADNTILWKKGGNFGAQCNECAIFYTKDPIWGNNLLNIGCTCTSGSATFLVDKSLIENQFGRLVCAHEY